MAQRLGVDTARDLRPRLLVSAALGALDAAWGAWGLNDSRDLAALVQEAHDLLDRGFAAAPVG